MKRIVLGDDLEAPRALPHACARLIYIDPEAIAAMARRLSWDEPELVGCEGILP